MTYTEQLIQKAVDGGYHSDLIEHSGSIIDVSHEDKDDRYSVAVWDRETDRFYFEVSKTFLDPKFWQALGQVFGWNKHGGNTQAHIKKWHGLVDCIAYGGSIESYSQKLIEEYDQNNQNNR